MTMSKFTARHESDLDWFFRFASGDLGLTSSFAPIANMLNAGIPQGGRSNPEHTSASFDPNSAVVRDARVRSLLHAVAYEHAVTLVGWYSPRRDPSKTFAWMDPKDAARADREWRAMLTPAERHFGRYAAIVVRNKLACAATVDRDMVAAASIPKGAPKAEVERLTREATALRADARKTVERAVARAVVLLADARVAYAVLERATPTEAQLRRAAREAKREAERAALARVEPRYRSPDEVRRELEAMAARGETL